MIDPKLLDKNLQSEDKKIRIKEVVHTIQYLKNRKAIIHGEILKLNDEDTLVYLSKFFNKFAYGSLTGELTQVYLVTIPKKVNSSDCNDNRTTRLMSHVLRINLIGQQFGFKNDFDTRAALRVLNMVEQ